MIGPAPDPAVADLASGRILRRNIVVSTLGIAARSCQLVLLLAIGRTFGPDALGRFLLCFGVFEIVAAVVSSGFSDGTLLLVSRRSQRTAPDRPNQLAEVVATALLVGGALALALATLAALLVGGWTLRTGAWPGFLPPGALWLAFALLPALIARVAFAATSGLLRMEWEAIVGAAAPALAMLLALPLLRAAGAGLPGLFATFFVVQLLLAILALQVLARRLAGRDRGLGIALRRPRLDRMLLAFALPQGINMAATTYIARLDLLMLAALGTPAAVVGGYGTMAALVLELRQVRMVVSGALAPIIARHHANGDRQAISGALSRGAAAVASIAVPLALGAAVVHGDLLAWLAPAVKGDAGFVLVLLIGPLFNCLGGLAGNFLIFLLRNRWNLGNSLLVAIVHTGACWWLIPRFGLAGAALSSALAMARVTVLENLELRLLDRVRIAPRALVRAGGTLAVGGGLLAAAAPFAAVVGLGGRVVVATGLALGAATAMRGRFGAAP